MENRNKAPAFQWYPKDILGSARVAQLSLAEEAAYRRALDFAWINDGLPNDADKLSKIIGKNCTIEIAEKVLPFFKKKKNDPDTVFSPRQQIERVKQKKHRLAKEKNGKKGSEKRWHNTLKNNHMNSNTINSPLVNDSFSSSSSSSSAIEKESKEKEKEMEITVSKNFSRPDFEDVKKYFFEKQSFTWANIFIEQQASKFFDYYESNGWKVGKNSMKDWKAAIRNWIKNSEDYGTNKHTNQSIEVKQRDKAAEYLLSTGQELLNFITGGAKSDKS